MINHIPVIVTDIGALGRRITELKCGWTISVDSIKNEFINIIEQISAPSKLDEVKNIIDDIKIPSIGEMAHMYEEISYEKAEYDLIYQGCSYYNKVDLNSNIATVEDIEAMNALKKEMDIIHQSVAYRIVNKLWRTPIPGRSVIKKIIKSFL